MSGTFVPTTSSVLNLLQKAIERQVEDNVPRTTPLLSVLKRNSGVTKMANNTFYVTEWVGNFSNVVQAAAGATLTGGDAANIQLNVSAKRLYSHVVVDEMTVESMKNVPKGALKGFVSSYAQRMELGIGREMNRTFNGDGDGAVARANGSSGGGTALTVQALDADTSDLLPTQYIEAGDYIKIGSGAAVQVTSISGDVLTISASRAWSDEDDIIKATSDGGSASEMAGLKELIVNTGTVQGVNVANYKNMQAYVDNESHSIASTAEQYMNLAYLKTVGYKVSQQLIGLCNLTVFNAWAKILTALKSTARTDENIMGGINLQGDKKDMPFLRFFQGKTYLDIDTWTNHWFNLDPESMTIGDLGGGVKFATAPDGTQKWSRVNSLVPSFEATLRFYGNLIMKNPKANAVLTGLTA